MSVSSKILPSLYLITPDFDIANETDLFIHQLKQSLISGIRLVQQQMVLLHGFIKKSQTTPKDDLHTALNRLKQIRS